MVNFVLLAWHSKKSVFVSRSLTTSTFKNESCIFCYYTLVFNEYPSLLNIWKTIEK
jgi:hypothetical protein